jgi:hypothetical protein
MILPRASLALLLLAPIAVFAQAPANDTGIQQTSSFAGFPARAVVGTASFDGSEPTMSPRFFRSGTPGDPCSTFSSGNFQYQEFPVRSDGTGSATASFDPLTCGTGIFVTFHTGDFNPANICEGYVWTFGSSAAFTETFAVPANSDMTMVVSGVANAPGVVCGPYSYNLQGLNPRGGLAPPPVPRAAIVPTLGEAGLLTLGLAALAAGLMLLRRRG